MARGLDPPAPRRCPRAGRRLAGEPNSYPWLYHSLRAWIAQALPGGVDEALVAVDVLGLVTIAAGMWLLARELGGGTPAAARRSVLAVAGGGFGWMWQHAPRCRAQHERRRPGPLSRRPRALERPRPRDREPAAARAPRPGRVHGPRSSCGRSSARWTPARERGSSQRARPAGSRSCARRLPASSWPRGQRGLRCGPRAARRLDGARRRRRRRGLARAAGRHLPPLRRLRRHHLAAADEPDRRPGGRRAGDRAPARHCRPGRSRCGAPGAAPTRGGSASSSPSRRPRASSASRSARGGRCSAGGAAPLAPIRPVPGARPGRPGRHRRRARPPRAAAHRPPAAAVGDRRGAAAALASTALAAVELGRSPAPATFQCRSLPIGYGDLFAVISRPQLGADRASLDVFARTGASAAYMTLVRAKVRPRTFPALADAGRAAPLPRRAPGRRGSCPGGLWVVADRRLARRRRRHADRGVHARRAAVRPRPPGPPSA